MLTGWSERGLRLGSSILGIFALYYIAQFIVRLVLPDGLRIDEAQQVFLSQWLAAGCRPFVYEAKGKAMRLNYFTAPEEAMESPALMQPWARLALQAAVAARAPRQKAPKKTSRRV